MTTMKEQTAATGTEQSTTPSSRKQFNVCASSHFGSCVIFIGLAVLLLFAALWSGFVSRWVFGGFRRESIYSSGDYVEVDFAEDFPEAYKASFLRAAKRWSEILNGTEIVPQDVRGLGISNSYNSQGCNAKTDKELPSHIINHLWIYAEVMEIDGEGGVLGQAGPCSWFGLTEGTPLLFTENTRILPTVGIMQFDGADLQDTMERGTLDSMILHEMGHVLGIGTLWDFAARSIAGQQYTVDLLHNPMYSFSGDKLYASPGNKPKYSGPAAKGAYKKLLGSSSTVDIPVEDGRDSSGNQRFDLSRGEGIGTVDGHWKQTVFGDELMTGYLADVSSPMSEVTILSLRDLGYTVNPELADAYTLPQHRSLRGRTLPRTGDMRDIVIRRSRQEWVQAFERWRLFHIRGKL